MRYDTIIFDLDGTLLNTLGDLSDSVNYALAACGMPGRSEEEVRRFVGNGMGKLVARAVPEGTPDTDSAKCLELFLAHYILNMENRTAPYPGMVELLRLLGSMGGKLAIVSNKMDSAVKGLAQTYFDGLVAAAIGERGDVKRKPAPDAVFAALRELDATADRAVYVGDSEVDLETAKNAGLPCIAVSWGFRDRDLLAGHGATCIVDDAEALFAALQ